MNPKIVARRIISKFQRAFMTVLVMMVVFGSLPVGRAQAAWGPIIDAPNIQCAWGKFNHDFLVSGNYRVAYKVLIYNWNTRAWSQTGFFYFNSTNAIAHVSLDVSQPSRSTISVMTEFWWLNGSTWVYYGRLPANYYAVNTSIELDKHNSYCTIG